LPLTEDRIRTECDDERLGCLFHAGGTGLGPLGFFAQIGRTWLDPKSAFLYEVMGALLTGWPYFSSCVRKWARTFGGIVPSVLTGVAGYLGLLFFMYALQTGKVSVMPRSPRLYPIVSLVLAFIFFREKLNLVQMAGMALAVFVRRSHLTRIEKTTGLWVCRREFHKEAFFETFEISWRLFKIMIP